MATTIWQDTFLSGGSHLFSTNLANKISSYERLADRIAESGQNYGLTPDQIKNSIIIDVTAFNSFSYLSHIFFNAGFCSIVLKCNFN